MSEHFLPAAERFGWPNACPACAAPLPTRAALRNPQDLHVGQRCPACHAGVAYIPEPLGEGRHRRTWWIPVRPSDRFSRLSGREIAAPSTLEWEELGGAPGRNFCSLDPTRTLLPRTPHRPWRGRVAWSEDVAVSASGPERIASVMLARDMLVVATEGGVLRFLDPETGKAVTSRPLQLRQELHTELLDLPPTFRGWWMAATAGRALAVADLSPMARNRDDTLLPRAGVLLPPGLAWATPPMAIDRDELPPLFAAVALREDASGEALFRVYDPAPVRDREAPRLVAEVPMCPASMPIQLPASPGFPRAGEVVWVGQDGGVHAFAPGAWTSMRLTPPPLGRPTLLPWSQGNLVVTSDRGEESLWMVHPDGDRHVLRRWPINATGWMDFRALDGRTGLDRAWIAAQPWLQDDAEPWVVVGGTNYYEIHRRGAADNTALNSGDHWQGDLTARANVAARTVAPPVLTPAGVVTFHPLEVRLTSPDPDRPGRLAHARVDDVTLCGNFTSFTTFAACRGGAVWVGTHAGTVVRVDFTQE